MKADIRQFFQDYVDAFNRAIKGSDDFDAIRGSFATWVAGDEQAALREHGLIP